MTKTNKFKSALKKHNPFSSSKDKKLDITNSTPQVGQPDITVPAIAPARTYQSGDLPTILFLSKRGMSRSPLAQEIMRDLIQKSSYFGRIRVSSRGVNIAYNDCSVDGRMQTYSSKLGLILHGTSKFATTPDLANASLIVTMDADSEDFVKIHKHAIRGQVRPLGVYLSHGCEPHIQDPYDRGEDTDVDERYEQIIDSVSQACSKLLSSLPSLVL
jgi:protein-tyrosine-phosphatase